ncbi:hypothetical protein [Fulvimarina pelagi]|uniref:hypothetical protein n=1 Tax=Fulvimarina pelagi TaxID=217511 RepID=UPI0012E3CD54|nr:hypothetical protein [Fulvimarina pelagi]
MAHDARAIANLILEEAQRRGIQLTEMQLIKLVYFVNGWSLELLDEPLVEDRRRHGSAALYIRASTKRCRATPRNL